MYRSIDGTTQAESRNIPAEWKAKAPDLMRWIGRTLFHRRDVYARYPGPVCVREIVDPSVIRRHCHGEHTIGAYTTDPDTDTVSWCGVDIDRHAEDQADPAANFAFATEVYHRLLELGLDPLLEDSNGAGGFHVWVFFSSPVPAATARRLLWGVVRDHQAHGVRQVELFPKQDRVSVLKEKVGNQMRVPGRHHKRDHWSRVWAAELWLEGAEAIDYMMGRERTSPLFIPEKALEHAPPTTTHTPVVQVTDIDLEGLDDEVVKDRADQARQFLWKRCNPSQAGRGASNYVLALATKIRYGFALPEDVATEIMADWGQGAAHTDEFGNPYPWTHQEMAHKVRAADPTRVALGSLLAGPGYDDAVAAVVGNKPTAAPELDQAVAEDQAFVEKYKLAEAAPAPKSKYAPLIKWAEIRRRAATDRPVWVIDQVVGSGELQMPCSLPWGGKSTLLAHAVGCVVQGKPFLGQATRQVPILYLNADRNGYELFVSRILPHLDEEGGQEAIEKYLYAPEFEGLQTPFPADYLDHYLDQILAEHPDAPTVWVIIDTLRAAYISGAENGSENDSSFVVTVLTPLRSLAVRRKVAITPVHHNNKAADDYAGSAGIAGCVDTFIRISRDKDSDTATVSIHTRRGYKSNMYVKRHPDGTLTRTDAEAVTKDEAELLEFIAKFPPTAPEALTRKEAKDLFPDMKASTFRNRLAGATRPGRHPRLEKLGSGDNASPFKYFRV